MLPMCEDLGNIQISHNKNQINHGKEENKHQMDHLPQIGTYKDSKVNQLVAKY